MNWGTVAGEAGTGATLGAGIGSLFGGAGAIPGAVIGGVAGGVYGLFSSGAEDKKKKKLYQNVTNVDSVQNAPSNLLGRYSGAYQGLATNIQRVKDEKVQSEINRIQGTRNVVNTVAGVATTVVGALHFSGVGAKTIKDPNIGSKLSFAQDALGYQPDISKSPTFISGMANSSLAPEIIPPVVNPFKEPNATVENPVDVNGAVETSNLPAVNPFKVQSPVVASLNANPLMQPTDDQFNRDLGTTILKDGGKNVNDSKKVIAGEAGKEWLVDTTSGKVLKELNQGAQQLSMPKGTAVINRDQMARLQSGEPLQNVLAALPQVQDVQKAEDGTVHWATSRKLTDVPGSNPISSTINTSGTAGDNMFANYLLRQKAKNAATIADRKEAQDYKIAAYQYPALETDGDQGVPYKSVFGPGITAAQEKDIQDNYNWDPEAWKKAQPVSNELHRGSYVDIENTNHGVQGWSGSLTNIPIAPVKPTPVAPVSPTSLVTIDGMAKAFGKPRMATNNPWSEVESEVPVNNGDQVPVMTKVMGDTTPIELKNAYASDQTALNSIGGNDGKVVIKPPITPSLWDKTTADGLNLAGNMANQIFAATQKTPDDYKVQHTDLGEPTLASARLINPDIALHSNDRAVNSLITSMRESGNKEGLSALIPQVLDSNQRAVDNVSAANVQTMNAVGQANAQTANAFTMKNAELHASEASQQTGVDLEQAKIKGAQEVERKKALGNSLFALAAYKDAVKNRAINESIQRSTDALLQMKARGLPTP